MCSEIKETGIKKGCRNSARHNLVILHSAAKKTNKKSATYEPSLLETQKCTSRANINKLKLLPK